MSTTTDEILEKLKTISLFEAKELVAQIEETFGVDASTPVGGIGAATLDSSGQAEDAAEEKTTFDVILESVAGDKKIAVLKTIRSLTSLGLKEAKDFTSSLPKAVKESVSKEEAEAAKQQLEESGGQVKIT